MASADKKGQVGPVVSSTQAAAMENADKKVQLGPVERSTQVSAMASAVKNGQLGPFVSSTQAVTMATDDKQDKEGPLTFLFLSKRKKQPRKKQAKCKCGESVSIQIDRFADTGYVRWIISTADLKYTKESLEGFAEKTAKKFYDGIKGKLEAAIKCQCDLKGISKKSFKCPYNVCHEFKAEVEIKSKNGLAAWQNVKLQDNQSAVELSKLYLTPETASNYSGPASVDMSALLKLIDGCLPIRGELKDYNTIQPVRETRNEIMHSCNMNMTEEDLAKHIKNFQALIESVPDKYVDTNTKRVLIDKLTPNDDTDALKLAEDVALNEKNVASKLQLNEWKAELKTAKGSDLKELKLKVKKHEIEMARFEERMRIYNVSTKQVEDVEKHRIEAAELFDEADDKQEDLSSSIKQTIEESIKPLRDAIRKIEERDEENEKRQHADSGDKRNMDSQQTNQLQDSDKDTWKDNPPLGRSKIQVDMKLKDTFDKELTDKSSESYKKLRIKFEEKLPQIFGEALTNTSTNTDSEGTEEQSQKFQGIEDITFTSGSIHVDFIAVFEETIECPVGAENVKGIIKQAAQTNSFGSFTVDETSIETKELPPWFTKCLDNQTKQEEETVTLTCQLSKPTKDVQWMKGDQEISTDDRITITADEYTHKLTIRDLRLEDAGDFKCLFGNINKSCTLTVKEIVPEFTKKLDDQTVKEKGTITLTCQLSNLNKTVEWFKGSQPIGPYNDRITVNVDKNTHQLTIRDLKPEDAGKFRCLSCNVSTHCTLNVEELEPEFTEPLKNQTVKETETATLTCQLSKPSKTVHWIKGDQQVSTGDRITITAYDCTHQLTIRDFMSEDAVIYWCDCGNASTCCTLEFEEVPVQFVKPLENTQGYTKSSTSTTLSCELNHLNRNVTWTKNGKAVSGNDNVMMVSGVYTHQLIFSKLAQGDAGIYTCGFRDVTTTAALTVQDDDDEAARELKLDKKSAEDVRKAVREKSVLHQLTLDDVDLSSLGDQLSDVLTLQHLVQLTLGCDVMGGDITLSHEQCQNLGRELRGSPQLRELTLSNINYNPIFVQMSECLELDLGGPLRLHGITLIQLPFTRVVFNPEVLLRCTIYLSDNVAGQVSTLQNLLAARNLQTFTYGSTHLPSIMMRMQMMQMMIRTDTCSVHDAEVINKLVHVLPQLHGLQQLTLCNIDFGSVTDIRLSATMDQLESVELNWCEFDTAGLECLLQQHNLPQRRVEINLYDVTIRGEEDVISKIRQSPDTEVTWDRDVQYRGGAWEVGGFTFYTRK